MAGCELCGVETKTKRVSLKGFGIVAICENCHVRLASAFEGRRAEIARQICSENKKK